ncbi:MAG: LLM class flavin-dependent oxidoreductase [Actinomycetota bacterium]|nr:LLM class flavin-dependent oxidoreductase [Actinomycetota bacterium]
MILSVLDQSPVPSGSTPAEAIGHTVALARAAERLGYRRYWLAEHHNTASLAGTAPEVLAAHVASQTSVIRVGAGGILLPYTSPLKAAEAFRVLHALFPGRIDLGVGRAAGTDEAGAAALGRHPGSPDDRDHPARVAELVDLLQSEGRADETGDQVRAMPEGEGGPEVWVLGSSSDGAGLAASLGLRFSFAHFVSPSFGPQTLAAYRRRFRASTSLATPMASVGVHVLCAEDHAEAEALALSHDVWRLRPEGADRGPLLAPVEAAAQPLSPLDRVQLAQQRERRVVGPPEQVVATLRALAGAYEVDELVVLTVCHDPAARLRSYQLLAEAFELGGRPAIPG